MVCQALFAATCLGRAFAEAPQRSAGPLLWVAARGQARVYLFPFGEAQDDSWFSSKIQNAIDACSELWLELGPPPPQARLDALYQELGHQTGRTFIDTLSAGIRPRALWYMKELKIAPQPVESLRPWLAYYTFAAAFDRKYGRSEGMTKAAPERRPPNFALLERARTQGKRVRAEMTVEESIRTLAALPDRLQSEYFEWLLDYFDEQRHGADPRVYGWMRGQLASASIDRMRAKWPDLYAVLDGRRNRWWASKVANLLGQGGSYFAAIGQDHFIGPQGIPQLLMQTRELRSAELKLT